MGDPYTALRSKFVDSATLSVRSGLLNLLSLSNAEREEIEFARAETAAINLWFKLESKKLISRETVQPLLSKINVRISPELTAIRDLFLNYQRSFFRDGGISDDSQSLIMSLIKTIDDLRYHPREMTTLVDKLNEPVQRIVSEVKSKQQAEEDINECKICFGAEINTVMVSFLMMLFIYLLSSDSMWTSVCL